MKILRSLILLNFIIAFYSISSFSQIVPKRLNDEYYVKSDYYFGFCFVTGANSSPVTFAIVKIIEDTDIEANIVSKESFLRMMGGGQECKANPENENLFEKYNIDPLVFNQLWKLKYSESPFFGKNEPGWAAKLYSPSEGQFNLLAQYGIYSFTSYCYGENMVKLLTDIQSSNWVNLYKGL
jgi:hypothetical protein